MPPFLGLLVGCLAAPAPRVRLPCGEVQGKWHDEANSISAFLGIPFAKAPVQELRWSPPRPAFSAPGDCWKGALNATVYGDICYQYDLNLGIDKNGRESEDCLNLNVYAKSPQPSRLLPVFFWIHGGSNVAGSNHWYDGLDHLPALWKDVCLIAPNYRLGVLGYLALKVLSEQDPRQTSGNYGIEDLRLALRWVQENAKAFGCDPSNVTIFGQSSGGTNVFALLSSRQNRGLFHRAVALSGSLNITESLHAAEAQGLAWVAATPCAGQSGAKLVQCLRSTDVSQVATPDSWASVDFWPSDPAGLPNPGLTVVDGVTVQMPFDQALVRGLVDVPFIMQYVRSELELFRAASEVERFSGDQYRQYLAEHFAGWSSSAGARIYDAYADVVQKEGVATAHYDLLMDVNDVCGAVDMALAAAKAPGRRHPVYVTMYVQPPARPECGNLTRAFHFRDFIVATQSTRFFSTCEPMQLSAEEMMLGAVIREQWLSLAKSGRARGLSPIRHVNNESSSYCVGVIGGQMGVVNLDDFRKHRCAVLKEVGLRPDSRFWWVN